MTRRSTAVGALVFTFFLVACGDGDWAQVPEQGSATSTSARGAVTTRPGDDGTAGGVDDAKRPECQELRILLKLDVTADQRKAIEKTLKGISEVETFRFEEAAAQSQASSLYHVRPAKLDQLQVVGQQIERAGLAGIVSVVYPRQFC